MNEQLQQALTAILNKTMSGVDAGVNFLSAEIPDVIHQLLMWKLVSNSILAFLGLAVLIASYKLIRKGLVNHATETAKGWAYEKEGRYIAPFMLGGVLSLFGSGLLLVNGMEALQIWIAPKIYLIEYAASLAK